MISVVVAATMDGGIGQAGGLPWPKLPEDMAAFRSITTSTRLPWRQNAVVMGRTTFDGLPVRPLPGRINVVLTSRDTVALPEGVLTATSLDAAVHAATAAGAEHVFVIGGARAITEALAHPATGTVYLTLVHGVHVADTFIPNVAAAGYTVTHERRTEHCTFQVLVRDKAAAHPETQYLDLVQHVLRVGSPRVDRTGVGTRASFGHTMRFSLAGNTLPLLTTKRVFWRGVAEELLWFIRGGTDARELAARGVHIWDANAAGREGDLGPIYGFQWRHFGAAYGGAAADHTGAGVDQLKAIIAAIKATPTDRRMVMSAWNPVDIPKMALPPCHVLCQFFVDDRGVSCTMYQRSADLGLGVPFNIASYALLTHLVAHVCGLPAAELMLVFGDTHVYDTHVDALRTQLARTPRPFPKLFIRGVTDIDAVTFEDLTVEGYDPHAAVKMPMAV
jgi:dihydrofolate reductase / thymidylate synthase